MSKIKQIYISFDESNIEDVLNQVKSLSENAETAFEAGYTYLTTESKEGVRITFYAEDSVE